MSNNNIVQEKVNQASKKRKRKEPNRKKIQCASFVFVDVIRNHLVFVLMLGSISRSRFAGSVERKQNTRYQKYAKDHIAYTIKSIIISFRAIVVACAKQNPGGMQDACQAKPRG